MRGEILQAKPGEGEPEWAEPAIHSPAPPHTLRDELVARISKSPHAFNEHVDRMVSISEDGGWRAALLVRELASDDVSKQLRKALPVKWLLIEAALRNRAASLEAAPVDFKETLILDAYSSLEFSAGESCEAAASAGARPLEADPFVFLRKLSAESLIELFKPISAKRLGLIGAFWKRGELGAILRALPETTRREAVLEYTRLSSLPPQVVDHSARQLAKELSERQAKLETERKRLESRARFESTAPIVVPELEDQLLMYLEECGPELGKLLRERYFCFERIVEVPYQILQPALARLEPEDKAGALFGAPAPIAEYALSALPSAERESTRAMIKTLSTTSANARSRTAISRQLLVARIQEQFEEQGVRWQDIVTNGGASLPHQARVLGAVMLEDAEIGFGG